MIVFGGFWCVFLVSGPDQPKESEKDLQAASVSLSDSPCSLDSTISTNRRNLGTFLRISLPNPIY
jgi:hypothetical protein